MTAKEKAKELVSKFLRIDGADDCGNSYPYVAKQCALICVDDKIASVIRIIHPMNTNRMNRSVDRIVDELKEIKEEINKL
jgi:hypothetical protein